MNISETTIEEVINNLLTRNKELEIYRDGVLGNKVIDVPELHATIERMQKRHTEMGDERATLRTKVGELHNEINLRNKTVEESRRTCLLYTSPSPRD